MTIEIAPRFCGDKNKEQFKILFLYFLGKRNLEDLYGAEI